MLYKHFYGFAMGIALRYCITRDDAMEAVNDGFIKVFKSIDNYQPDKPFKAWLRTIIVNTAIDSRRKEMKQWLNTELDSAAGISTCSTVIAELNARDIMLLLNKLPNIHRLVFNMYEVDGYSHDEIAGQLGIPASSSRVYLTRAKEKLRKMITS